MSGATKYSSFFFEIPQGRINTGTGCAGCQRVEEPVSVNNAQRGLNSSLMFISYAAGSLTTQVKYYQYDSAVVLYADRGRTVVVL